MDSVKEEYRNFNPPTLTILCTKYIVYMHI